MSKREEDGKASGGDRRLIGLLGLAMRAGALAFGTEQVCGEIDSGAEFDISRV